MILLVVYILCALGYYRLAYPVVADVVLEAEDRVEFGMAAAITMISAAMWPLCLLGYVVWRFATPNTPAQREAELDERERHIEEMERDLGIEDR